ncbi:MULTISPECIES: hypothetical protein [unclassified Pseudofrankia]|uniref:hypothetical protein n=1 Tax=unclassified Pseudofrankia TaxID=2994372 RepID=UPI00104200CD|nr:MULTISPECIES: hypothetical protein [unclassified Pseudofrankia]MDT3446733.1 hypothetical protein [Pseudofrankia sp. BMG5.37]
MAEFGDGPRDTDPYWSWWINDEQMRWHEAALLDDLGEYEDAIDSWQEYLATRSDNLYLSLSLANLARAQVHASAWTYAESTVSDLVDCSDDIHSGLAIASISQLANDVRRSLAAPRSLREATRLLASFAKRLDVNLVR